MPFDSGQLNREHPFLFAQLQSSNDGTIVIGSGGRGSCELCHLNSPRGLAINQGYSTLAAARPHRIFTRRDMAISRQGLLVIPNRSFAAATSAKLSATAGP